jgi:aspartate/methionine/tyrosine aminotransferase
MKIQDFKLERFFAQYEFNVDHILCSSDCESFKIGELLKLERRSDEKFKEISLGYTETLGDPDLRKEISKSYNSLSPDNLIVFSGAEEGIFIFMNVLLEKGDNIIVQYPAYQSLFEVANALGCKTIKWPMNDLNKDRWDLDFEFLHQNINKNTKAIVINSPHNPTGHLFTKQELYEIVDIARDNELYLFSDEVYRFLEYNENDRLPAVADLYEKGISLGDMSKPFGLAGLRIGWIGTKHKELFKNIASFKDYTTICNSAASEFLATLALKNKKKILSRNLEIIKKNLIHLDSFFNSYKHLFKWIKPRAGSIAFPKLKINKDIEDITIDLIDRKQTLIMPSTNYQFGNKHFRIGFGRKSMEEALKMFEEYLNENF